MIAHIDYSRRAYHCKEVATFDDHCYELVIECIVTLVPSLDRS